jgi:hypothetical protein
MTTLDQMVEEIRRDYFPRWDQGRRWQVREGSRATWIGSRGETRFSSEWGYCERDTLTIWINSVNKETIIHEICHAVTNGGHGQLWSDRMRKAARRADDLGDAELAARLSEDAEGYRVDPLYYLAAQVYERVGDVLLDAPDVSFYALIDYLASETSLTPDEIHKRYRRLRAVYNEEQRRAREMHEAMAAGRAKIEGKEPHGQSWRPGSRPLSAQRRQSMVDTLGVSPGA